MANTINNVNEVQVINNHGELVVSSRKVAEDFGKDHAKVLRNIEKHMEDLKATNPLLAWFMETSYIDGKGESRKEYLMNRDGFALLVMSFNNTRNVLEWKIKYIEAFNRMEKQLKELSAPKTLDGLFTIDNIYMIVSKLKEEHDGLMAKIATQNVTIKNLEAQVKNTMLLPETLEVAPDDDRLYTVTDIGKEFGLTARALNKLLIEWNIQKCAGAHYEVCEGLDDSKFVHYKYFQGHKASMKWTGSGRLLIHKRLKEHGYNLVK